MPLCAAQALYDSAVDFRIRLEPLVDLARRFPVPPPDVTTPAAVPPAAHAAAAALDALAAQLDVVASAVQHAAAPALAPADDEPALAWQTRALDNWAAHTAASSAAPTLRAADTRPSAAVRRALDAGTHLRRARRLRAPLHLLDGVEVAATPAHPPHFDDGELYRGLLRDVIDAGDAPGGGLRYAQLAREGRVRKPKDRRASKGRKLRYVTHEKLVGFVAPTPLPHPGPVDEILAALFGAGTR